MSGIRFLVFPGLAASIQPGGLEAAGSFRPASHHRVLSGGSRARRALEAWTSRFEMNPDGIQYLDNPSAYRQGDFRDALNPQWSPLYPWPIAGAEAMVRPSREQGVRARARRQFHTFRG